MAKDAKTRELLSQLHGGWPTELRVLDAKQVNEAYKEPPPAGIAVVLRVADLQLKDVKTNAGMVPFREIAFGHVVRIKDAAITDLPTGRKEPSAGEALDLAIEEYLLRNAPGWIARRATGPSTSFEDDQRLSHAAEELQLPPNLAAQRRELEKNIKNYAEQAKAYYGGLPKP